MAHEPPNTAYEPPLLCHMNDFIGDEGGLQYIEERPKRRVWKQQGCDSVPVVFSLLKLEAGTARQIWK